MSFLDLDTLEVSSKWFVAIDKDLKPRETAVLSTSERALFVALKFPPVLPSRTIYLLMVIL